MLSAKEKADIYASIGSEFVSDGFRYWRTGKTLERVNGKLTDVISFRSFRSGGSEVRANVKSADFEAWSNRNSYPLRSSYPGMIGGWQLENIFKDGPPFIYYDFDNRPALREQKKVAAAIRDCAFPFFELAQTPERLCKAFEDGTLPALQMVDLHINFFVWREQPSLAARFIKALLRRSAKDAEDFRRCLEKFKKELPQTNALELLGLHSDGAKAAVLARHFQLPI